MTAWANMFRHPGLYIAFKTGPGVLNRAVSRALFQSLELKAQLPVLRIDDQARFNDFVEEYEVHYKVTHPGTVSKKLAVSSAVVPADDLLHQSVIALQVTL